MYSLTAMHSYDLYHIYIMSYLKFMGILVFQSLKLPASKTCLPPFSHLKTVGTVLFLGGSVSIISSSYSNSVGSCLSSPRTAQKNSSCQMHIMAGTWSRDLSTIKFKTWHFVSTRNEESREKISRIAKFEVCSIGI